MITLDSCHARIAGSRTGLFACYAPRRFPSAPLLIPSQGGPALLLFLSWTAVLDSSCRFFCWEGIRSGGNTRIRLPTASTLCVHTLGSLLHTTPYGTMTQCLIHRTAAHVHARYEYTLNFTMIPLSFANDGSHSAPCANGRLPTLRFRALMPFACGPRGWTSSSGSMLHSFCVKKGKTS